MQKQYLIIVAGGSGSRMNSDIPKQFIELNGEALITIAIRCFLNYNASIHIIVSVHKDYKMHMEGLIEKSGFSASNIQTTFGGETRFESVKNGLKLVDDPTAVVGIHDAARPFVSLQTIKSCFETALIMGNAIPGIVVNESLRKINNGSNHAVKRNEYRIIQTPQCFLVSEIKKAFEQPYQPEFTDDATVLESTGKKINLVEGNVENIKITSPYDLKIAQTFLENE